MGVPVVSLKGRGMVGRLSASLLHHAGLEHWIANSKDEYVEIAKSLVSEGGRTLERRMQLRNSLEHSQLADGARLSTELERIYENLRQKIKWS